MGECGGGQVLPQGDSADQRINTCMDGKMKILQSKKFKNTVMAVLLLGYLIFNGILLAGHELWRDEANVWLIAGKLTPFQLLKEIKYQGHPCLWYLLLMPLAKSGLPLRTIVYVSYGIMAAGAGIFLYRAPVSLPVKALCLFSPIFTYYYSVIARNYCLVALFLLILALDYQNRNRHPVRYGTWLFLLVQSDTVALAPAGMICLMWLSEGILKSRREKNTSAFLQTVKGLWLPLASLVLWMAEFYQVSDSPVYQVKQFGIGELTREIRNYVLFILERMTGRSQLFCTLFLLAALLLLCFISYRIRSFWALTVLMASWLFQALFSVMVYQLHIWHFISLAFVWLWALWVIKTQGAEREILFSRLDRAAFAGLEILTVCLAVTMFARWNDSQESSSLSNALYGSYSDAESVSEYIEETLPEDAVIVTDNVAFASTVAAYLPDRTFYFAGTGQEEGYADWSERQSRVISTENLLRWAEEKWTDQEAIYLLDSAGSCITDQESFGNYEILYQTDTETARGEEYTLYRIKMPHK